MGKQQNKNSIRGTFNKSNYTKDEIRALQVWLALSLGAALALYSPSSDAMINVINGSLHAIRTDEVALEDGNLRLQRSFDSRSLYIGYFGLGWCSDLEYKLTIEKESIQLQKCDEMVSSFTAERSLQNLPQPVQGLNQKNSQGRELLWRSNHQPGVFLVNEKKGLAIYANNQRQFLFDQDGRLTAILHGGKSIELYYKKEKLVRLQTEQQSLIVDSAKAFHRILRLQRLPDSGKGRTIFHYDDSGQLRKVESDGNFERYSYDDLGNLTSVVTPQGQVLQAEYDQTEDLLRKYVDETTCRFDISYPKTPALVSGSSKRFIEKTCPNEKKKSFEIDIQSAQLPREKIYIQEIRLGTEKGRYSLQVDAQSGLLKRLSRLVSQEAQ